MLGGLMMRLYLTEVIRFKRTQTKNYTDFVTKVSLLSKLDDYD